MTGVVQVDGGCDPSAQRAEGDQLSVRDQKGLVVGVVGMRLGTEVPGNLSRFR